MSSECELCGEGAAEEFMTTCWADRHVCRRCADSLLDEEEETENLLFFSSIFEEEIT